MEREKLHKQTEQKDLFRRSNGGGGKWKVAKAGRALLSLLEKGGESSTLERKKNKMKESN